MRRVASGEDRGRRRRGPAGGHRPVARGAGEAAPSRDARDPGTRPAAVKLRTTMSRSLPRKPRVCFAVLAVLAVLAAGCGPLAARWPFAALPPVLGRPSEDAPPAERLEQAGPWRVRVLRDAWGVPHLFGERAADVAFGLGLAHAEDDPVGVQRALLAGRGALHRALGPEARRADWLIHWLGVPEDARRLFQGAGDPELRGYLDAYAAGVEHHLARNPRERIGGARFGGADVAGAAELRLRLFFLAGPLRELARRFPESDRQAREAGGSFRDAVEVLGRLGFGAFPRGEVLALSGSRTEDGAPRLWMRTLPPPGEATRWYEAHLESRDGLAVAGMLLPGLPVPISGVTPTLAFALTANRPPLVDVLRLDVRPDDLEGYRLDGHRRRLRRRAVPLPRRLLGLLPRPGRAVVEESELGPVLRLGREVLAVRFPGRGRARSVAGWLALARARDLDALGDALDPLTLPLFHLVAVDREGGLLYRYNAALPRRDAGAPVGRGGTIRPAGGPAAAWRGIHPRSVLPSLRDPASGFVQSANSSPFTATVGAGALRPGRLDAERGVDAEVTNRSLRLLEEVGSGRRLREADLEALFADVAYSGLSPLVERLEELLALPPPEDPRLARARRLLLTWDLRLDPESRAAALAVATLCGDECPEGLRGAGGSPFERLEAASDWLEATFGRLDPPWSEVLRLRHGEVDRPVAGGPDVLADAAPVRAADGRLVVPPGGPYVLRVRFGPDGVAVRSLAPPGSSVRASSPHAGDQLELLLRGETRPLWLRPETIRNHLDAPRRP